jgi:hypothetical protein
MRSSAPFSDGTSAPPSAALDELDAVTIREAQLSKSMNFTG